MFYSPVLREQSSWSSSQYMGTLSPTQYIIIDDNTITNKVSVSQWLIN